MVHAISSQGLAEVERSLSSLARQQRRPRAQHEGNIDPLNELAKLIGETHEQDCVGAHEILMRALGVTPAPPVRPPRLCEAFYERPFFRDQRFLVRRRFNLAASTVR